MAVSRRVVVEKQTGVSPVSKHTKKRFVDYQTYITSDKWYSKHRTWLAAVGNYCTMFPWVRLGNGYRYVIHHMNYKNLGDECLGRDVVPLCPFAHDYVIHGILAGFKSAGKQRNYPNLAQRLAHLWCVQRRWFKGVLALLVLWKLAGMYLTLR